MTINVVNSQINILWVSNYYIVCFVANYCCFSRPLFSLRKLTKCLIIVFKSHLGFFSEFHLPDIKIFL